MADEAIALRAHLMRRVGVGATRSELEELSEQLYEQIVEELLHPEEHPNPSADLLDRYFPAVNSAPDVPGTAAGLWIFNLANSGAPLGEKMALFWHHVFATGWFKSEHGPAIQTQIDMFRANGLSNLREILLDLSRDPVMIHWLDNCENHADEINENYGRELLELFSMGIGNYSEDDIKAASRAFTGWTFEQPIPLYPNGGYDTKFVFLEDDHDNGEKTFLGHTGNLNGEDIIDIIVQQEACARFIARHLYNFFVADEPQVPAWSIEPPGDPGAIDELIAAFMDSDGDMRVVMRTLLNSDFFKAARFARVKSPAEFVGGAIKLADWPQGPEPALNGWSAATTAMGQKLMDPPSVEGWHTGKEWLDGGTLTERVNFAVEQVMDTSKPGVQAIIERLASANGSLEPAEFVERCLDLSGPLDASEDTRRVLEEFAAEEGPLNFGSDDERVTSEARVGRMLQLIVASPEYQFT
jgi:uncharacterized protein (DUF1800 family)